MPNQPISFTSPAYDYSADVSAIERRKKMAEMLQSQGLQQPQEQPVGQGQFASRTSPFQYAAKLAQVAAGLRQQSKADEQQKDLSRTAQQDLASVLTNAQRAASGTPATPLREDASSNVTPAQPAIPGDTGAAASIYMRHPMTAPLGMQMMQKDQEQQQRARMLAQVMGQGAGAGSPQAPAYGSPGFSTQPSNPLSGISPQAMALMTSGDPELSKLGTAVHTSTQTQGRVFYDQNGNGFTVNHAGQSIPLPGIQQRVKPEAVNLGGETQFVDPYKQGGTPLPHTLTPQNKVENWWNMGVGAPPGAPQAPQTVPSPTTPQPAAPQARGNLNIPPRERAKLEAERPHQNQAAVSTLNGLHNSISEIERLEQQPGLSNITGPVGGRTWNMTGTATNAQANLDTLKAQIGVNTLTAMREASKTGGAVGSVTEKEWPILQNQLGALQQSQTTAEFRKNLSSVKETIKRVQDNVTNAYELTYGKLGWKPPVKPQEPLSERERAELERLRGQFGRRP